MTCGYCGAVVPEGMAYCPVCGAKVNTGLPPEDALADADQEVRPILAEAYLALRRRDFRRAEEKCIEALRHFPNNASAHAMLAEVYEAQGRLDDAIEWLRMALDLDPENERIKRRLAELQAKREERERAGEAVAEPARPPRAAPEPTKRRVWKVAGLVGVLVAILVVITYFAGGLAYRGRAGRESSEGGLAAPPEVGGVTSRPAAVRPSRPAPALPPQRPVQPALKRPAAEATSPSEAQPGRTRSDIGEEAEPSGRLPEAPPAREIAEGALLRLLPPPPPYTAGVDVRQYLLGYLRQVARLQKGEVQWVADWVEVDQNRNFVTVFAHVEGATDQDGLARAARRCATLTAAAVVRSYPPAYWLSVRVRGGHAQGPLLLVADFDRAGMIQALHGAGAPLESLAVSVWWNPTYLGPPAGHGKGGTPRR